LPATARGDEDLQPHEAIRAAAREFLLRQARPDTGDLAVQVERPDTRLRLSRCDRPLETFLPPSRKTTGRVTVGVRCTGSHPWSMYLPARVQRFDSVVTVKRDLRRGDPIRAGDLRRERRDLTQLARGYILDPKRVIGKVLKRSVRRGQPLNPALLDTPRAVRRGGIVDIVADIGGVQARMQGKALEHGSLGERIRIENAGTKKELEARIISAGTVQVDI
jgi:flagella basal body P-ring formation protein FlgA